MRQALVLLLLIPSINSAAISNIPTEEITKLTEAINQLTKAINEHKKTLKNSALYNDRNNDKNIHWPQK